MYTYKQVSSERRGNNNKSWASSTPDPGSARERFLSGDVFIVNNKPRFKLEPGQKIYTIGSCFARNVEQELSRRGFDLPSTSYAPPPHLYVSKTRFTNTILNKYTPHSMADEVLRATGRRSYKDNGLIQVGEDKWYDPQTSHLSPTHREEALEIRRALDQVASNLLTADALLMTLGLSETWLYNPTGAVLNQLMSSLVPILRDDISFFNSSFSQSYETMKEAISALNEVNPKIKIVVTVSPVPFGSTFTGQDVVAANTLSKSSLRCVADQLTKDFGNVDYYPSYEMVLNSPRAMTWADDQIHVSDEVVSRVIGTFAERYAA